MNSGQQLSAFTCCAIWKHGHCISKDRIFKIQQWCCQRTGSDPGALGHELQLHQPLHTLAWTPGKTNEQEKKEESLGLVFLASACLLLLYSWSITSSSMWSRGIRSWSWGGVKPNLPSFRGLRRGRLQGVKPCKFSEICPKSIHGQGHSRLVTMRPSLNGYLRTWILSSIMLVLHSIPKQPCLEKHLYALVSQSPLLTDTEQWWKTWFLPVGQVPTATGSWL